MKGVNAIKIGVLAAGTLLLASSAIAAGVMYQDVELVNANGQPTAKIVVGSTAAISDGVAAANIASVLANHAYKSSTLTAAVDGQATCAAGGSGTGAGTCQISNEQVTITINLPGVLGNAYQFKTLITDTIDKTLGNRNNTRSEDNFTVSTTADDQQTPPTLSPLRAAFSGNTAANLYRIGGETYLGFATANVNDPQASSDFSYTEEQNFWVGSSQDGVVYDSGSAYRQVVAKPNVIAYDIRFLNNAYGIPMCTKANDAGDGNWAWCTNDSTSQYLSGNHRIQIWFLGSQWVISSMSGPSTTQSSSTSVNNGGTVKLAKEAKYDIVNVGGVIDGGTFKIRLADISVATGSANTHPAIIDILDANDAVIGQIQVNPGDTYTFTQSTTGQSIKVHVYRTAPGFTLNAKWAEMAIYTDEITLQDGSRYNLASTGDANYNVKVSLLWKNRDATGSNSNQSDSLRQIVIYDQDTFTGVKYVPGNSYGFPPKAPAYQLTYNGLDLTDSDYAQLSITGLSSSDYPISANGQTDCTAANNADKWTYHAKLIQIKSDGVNFGGAGDVLNNYRVDKFYYDPIGRIVDGQLLADANSTGVQYNDSLSDSAAPSSGSFYLNGTQNTSTNANASLTTMTNNGKPQWRGLLFYKPSGFNCYVTANLTYAVPTTATSGADFQPGNAQNSSAGVRFDFAGTESSAQGQIWFATNNRSIINSTVYGTVLNTTTLGANDPTQWQRDIVVQEDAGRWDGPSPVSHQPIAIRVPFFQQSSSVDTDTWRFKASDSTTSTTYYAGVRQALTTPTTPWKTTSYEPILYTERGSKVVSVSTSDWQAKIAKKVGQPTFTFAPVQANGTVSTGSDWIAKVGDTKSLPDGAVLTVKDISENVGACVAGSSGAAPACTVNMQPVTAKIMPDNVASVEVSQPYDIKANPTMVMQDTDASNVGGVVITVGGPAVNTVTANVIKDANIDFHTTSVVVKAFGSKIVVAGNTAADTMQAANEFIAALQTS